MRLDEAQSRLDGIKTVPAYYVEYYSKILHTLHDGYQRAASARRRGIDVADVIEPKVAYDLADRVAKMHDLDIGDRLRALLSATTKEKTALKIAEEIALGDYGVDDLRERLDSAVRVSLAVVTEGVTVAPLQGIADVQIKSNSDGSQYLSVSFAGPIRSAGGTEAALTMLIADHARKVVGLAKYAADSFDDETGRFVEELRVYEREVMGFQFKVLDEDVVKCISLLPVELDGVDTDPVEVVGHKGMRRIATDRVRGGALRVMNDGLIGRSRKLLKLVESLKLEGWEWLKELKGAIQTGEDDAAQHRMAEVITGRPVLSMTKKVGGFRLRYGRSCNTGFATVGIHPAVPVLLNHAIVSGTQIKMDVPGKASTLAVVDSIEAPIVRLDDGKVTQVRTAQHAEAIKGKVSKILYLGDMLISYGDFLENNAQLLPASYTEEVWSQQLRAKLVASDNIPDRHRLVEFARDWSTAPSLSEALQISEGLGLPLHPRYLLYWDSITPVDAICLAENLRQSGPGTMPFDEKLKDILERLGVYHSVADGSIVFDDADQETVLRRLLREPPGQAGDTLALVTQMSGGIIIMRKFASSVAVRVGRPEKAAERKMKPPVHVLFPIGNSGGATRDILKASRESAFFAEIANRFCPGCKIPSIGTHCRKCGESTLLRCLCMTCHRELEEGEKCPRCNKDGITHASVSFPLKQALDEAQKKVGQRAHEPLKGVKSLMSRHRAAEPLEKGILRQKHSLYAFKDGTIRFDATNVTLTHFRPEWTGVSVEKLRELGYSKDCNGQELVSSSQLVELMLQDIIIPRDCAMHLVNAANFVDDELASLYGIEKYYNLREVGDLIGHIVVGLAPHTSVGIIGRIIGFVDSQACFASPIWHSAKRRDCDGDADSLMLVMDAFLNFSFDFLPDKIGGLMDAPLLLQPIVLPYEVQRQAQNVDIAHAYSMEFFESTWKHGRPGELASKIETIGSRAGQESQFYGFDFTHSTSLLTTSEQRSAYSSLNTMEEKLKMQFDTAKLISAVDPNEVASMVLTTHILPDIMGNMRSYSSQMFRCTSCGEKYRRLPLLGSCAKCGNAISPTVTRGSVEKYLSIATDMCAQYKVGEYLNSRVQSLSAELKLLFREPKKTQSFLTEFMS